MDRPNFDFAVFGRAPSPNHCAQTCSDLPMSFENATMDFESGRDFAKHGDPMTKFGNEREFDVNLSWVCQLQLELLKLFHENLP